VIEVARNVMTGRLSDPDVEVARLLRGRRRARLLRFVALETLAVALIIVSVIAGLSERFASESLTKIFELLPVAFAIVAVGLPIFFFGHPRHRGPRL
jgi:uncharacterized membrane protein YoaK (UPF0700 family)